MRRNVLALSLAGFLSISMITIFSLRKNALLTSANDECQHSGFHYDELLPCIDAAGHKEFWTCCKCHEVFLEEPEEGKFVDQEDSLMSGGIDEEHAAYVAPIKVKSLSVNGRRYYPLLNDGRMPEGVSFFDSEMNELVPEATGYPMCGLGNAVYYTAAELTSFSAVSFIENVSFDEIYGSGGTGINYVSNSFISENNITDDEVVEMLTLSGEPSSTEAPAIKSVAFYEIWQSYRMFGFSSSFKFWSCVSKDLNYAYAWNNNTMMWMQEIRSNKMSICLSKTFH